MSQHRFDWANPYPTLRTPVFARNIVATSQPLAASAGLIAMRRGGNAVDAAVAGAAAISVTEPCSNGPRSYRELLELRARTTPGKERR